MADSSLFDIAEREKWASEVVLVLAGHAGGALVEALVDLIERAYEEGLDDERL